MLTIQKPLRLESGKDIRSLPQKLNNTIEKNYTIIREDFTAQDLLFLLVNPQNVVAEETNLNNTNVFNNAITNHKLSVEVLNNFVNRITNYGTADFTYQDSVYITNVLSKLGITNVSEFMKEVENVSENVENISKLLRVYSENMEMLKVQSSHYISQSADNSKTEEGDEIHYSRYYLQNEIFNRLRTENIYETVYNFTKPSNQYVSNISNDRMLVSEQTNVFRQLKLMQLKQEAGVLDESIYNSLTNIYEKHENNQREVTRESVLSNGAAAALVSLITNLAVNKAQENISRNTWVNAEKAFYKAGENSLKRFELLTEESNLSILKNDVDITEINNNYRQEIEAILKNEQNLLNMRHTDGDVYSAGDTVYDSKQEIVYRSEKDEIYNTEENNQEYTARLSNEVRNTVRNEIQKNESRTEVTNKTSDERNVYNEKHQLVYQQNTGVSQQHFDETSQQLTQNYSEINDELTQISTNQDFRNQDFMTQLKNLNERNVRIQNEVNNIKNEHQTVQRPVVKVDNRKLMNAALRAMDEPEKAIKEFFSEVKIEKPEVDILNLYPQIESLDPESKRIYESLLLIHQNPQKAIDEGIITSGNMGMLMADLAEANKASEENPPEDFVPAPMETLRQETVYDREISETAIREIERQRAAENMRLDDEIEKKAVQSVENYITAAGPIERRKEKPFEPAVMLERTAVLNDFSEIRNLNRNIFKQKKEKETVLEKEMEKVVREVIGKEEKGRKKGKKAGNKTHTEITKLVGTNIENNEIRTEAERILHTMQIPVADEKSQREEAEGIRTDIIHRSSDTVTTINREIEVLRQAGIEKDAKVAEAINTVHETISPIERRSVKTEREVQQFHKEAPIVHKKVNDISDEIIEELNRATTKKSEQTVQQVIEKNVELDKVQINNISEQVIEKTSRKIEKTIERSMSDQLDELTDRVYDQIERRLRDERSRRGY